MHQRNGLKTVALLGLMSGLILLAGRAIGGQGGLIGSVKIESADFDPMTMRPAHKHAMIAA